MPYKEPAFSVLVDFYRNHQKSVTSAVIALLCVIARSFYSGSKWREIVGDVIFCPLVAVLLGNHLPALELYGFVVDHTIIAAAVGVGGMHMIKLLACWAFERKTGVSLKEKQQ